MKKLSYECLGGSGMDTRFRRLLIFLCFPVLALSGSCRQLGKLNGLVDPAPALSTQIRQAASQSVGPPSQVQVKIDLDAQAASQTLNDGRILLAPENSHPSLLTLVPIRSSDRATLTFEFTKADQSKPLDTQLKIFGVPEGFYGVYITGDVQVTLPSEKPRANDTATRVIYASGGSALWVNVILNLSTATITFVKQSRAEPCPAATDPVCSSGKVVLASWDTQGCEVRTCVIDATMPEVSIQSPSVLTTELKSITVLARAWDAVGVQSVKFRLDGTLVGTVTSEPYSVNLDNLSFGSHTVQVTALDASGNSASSSLTFEVVDRAKDVAAPAVSIVAPIDGAIAPVGDAIVFEADASDSDGMIGSVQFFVDGSAVGSAITQAPYRMSHQFSGSGGHAISATATDLAGHTGTSSSVSIVIQDSSTDYLLVNNRHTKTECFDDGGELWTVDTTKFCKFSGSSCPSGWNPYDNWSETKSTTSTFTEAYCSGNAQVAIVSDVYFSMKPSFSPTMCYYSDTLTCTTGEHAFSNKAAETNTCQSASVTCGQTNCSVYSSSPVAQIVAVGCY